jgi:c-di-AMP phosphodiesterase-like protein
MINLCPPAIIYLIFSITQILIDLYNGLYNTVAMKLIVTVMVTLLLNILCQRGLNTISWIIVFIPFILMTVIVTLLLYIFGLNSTTGSLNYSCQDSSNNVTNTTTATNNVTVDANGNIIIYNPYYNSLTNPVYYQSPNVIVPKPPTAPSTNSNTTSTSTTNTLPPLPPSGSSNPAYQS